MHRQHKTSTSTPSARFRLGRYDPTRELIMTQAPILLATNNGGAEAYTITLARDVTLFKLAFYDDKKNEWLEEWKYTNQLPRLVQIALGLGKTDGNASKPYDLTTSLVALPSVAVLPDIQGGAIPVLPGAGGITNRNGLRGGQFDPNNPGQFQNPNQNLNDPRFNRGAFPR